MIRSNYADDPDLGCNHFVVNKVEANQGRALAAIEVTFDCVTHFDTQLFHRICFSEYCRPNSTGNVAPFWGFFHQEDNFGLHEASVTQERHKCRPSEGAHSSGPTADVQH